MNWMASLLGIGMGHALVGVCTNKVGHINSLSLSLMRYDPILTEACPPRSLISFTIMTCGNAVVRNKCLKINGWLFCYLSYLHDDWTLSEVRGEGEEKSWTSFYVGRGGTDDLCVDAPAELCSICCDIYTIWRREKRKKRGIRKEERGLGNARWGGVLNSAHPYPKQI